MNAGAVARLGAAAAVLLATGCSSSAVDAPPTSPAASDEGACRALLDALPERVADLEARPVQPDAAWSAAWGDPPIVLTCGVPRPAGLTRVSTCTTVNGIDWYIPEEQLESSEPVDLTMTTVYRRPYVEVRLPAEQGPPATTLVDLSEAVAGNTERTGACV